MDITSNRIPATPRSKYARYGNNNVSISGSSGGANIDTSNFVRLRGQTSQSIEGAVAATGEIIAYQTNPEAGDFQFPIASTDALGTIKVGNGLKINEDGTLSVDGEIGGGGASSWDDLTDKPTTFPSTWEQVTGKPTEFRPSAHTHVMNDITDFNGVTTDTDQTITGQKTFSKAILGQADVVAYATGKHDITFPIASKTALGCIKVGENLTITEDGTLNAQAGGGITSVTWSDVQDKPSVFPTDWANISNKPSIFTPSSHTHNWGDINNVPKGNFNQYGVVKLASSGGLGLYDDLLMLAPANGSQIGGVRIGSGINVTSNGTISVTTSTIGAAPSSHTHSQYVNKSGDTMTGNLNIDTNSDYSYLRCVNNSNKYIQFSSQPNGGGVIQDEGGNTGNKFIIQVGASYPNNVIFQGGNISAAGDIVAYSTGAGTQSPFKYWKPSVSSSGVLSWTNSTSEVVPSSVNIKGTKGDKGDKGDTGAQGPKGDRGATGPQGPQGPAGSSFTGGTVQNTTTFEQSTNHKRGAVFSGFHYNTSGAMLGNVVIEGAATQWEAAQIMMINNSLSNYGKRWKIQLGGSGLGNGDLQFQSDNGSTGSSTSSPYFRFKIFKHGTATNACAGAGAYSNASDIRLKNRGGNITGVLDTLNRLNVFHFTMKDDELKLPRIGVSAQEVQEVYPEFVSNIGEETDEILGVDYAGLATTVAIEGCKELHNIIKEQQVKINELESRLASLETKNHLKDEEAN